jgi:hypothetical protein
MLDCDIMTAREPEGAVLIGTSWAEVAREMDEGGGRWISHVGVWEGGKDGKKVR